MKTYLTNIWDWLRTSLWFVPAILGTFAVVMAILLPLVDHSIATANVPGIRTTATAARATLSAIAGAMMAVTGTVFSITIVTLSLTSQQFGPRLLRTFMHDFPTQFAMGTFLSTGLYCLLVLRIVEEPTNGTTVPHLSVGVAVLLTVFSMGTLIYFIHHVAVLIQAPRVVEAVARDLQDAIERLFPEGIGEPPSDGRQQEPSAIAQARNLGDDFSVVPAAREGYIQAVDADGLMTFAREKDLVVRLRKRPGHFASRGTALAYVWRGSRDAAKETAARLNEFFFVGTRRTPRQDVECAIEELVEVAVRSLSPGINDPFTAITCIDWLKSSMLRLTLRKIPASHRCDKDGQLRLIAPTVTFSDAMNVAFSQIRHYGSGSAAVMIRLLDAFLDLAEQVRRDEDRSPIQQHADIVLHTAERSLSEESDTRIVKERHAAIGKALKR